MGTSFIVKKRHVTGSYRSRYGAKGVTYSPWKTVSQHPTLEEAVAAARNCPHVGLQMYVVFHEGHLVWKD